MTHGLWISVALMYALSGNLYREEGNLEICEGIVA
jgi:hypothetical protein